LAATEEEELAVTPEITMAPPEVMGDFLAAAEGAAAQQSIIIHREMAEKAETGKLLLGVGNYNANSTHTISSQ
jgi:hypothetical protein